MRRRPNSATGPLQSPRLRRTTFGGAPAGTGMRYIPVAVLLLTSIVSRAASQMGPLLPRPGDRVRIWVADGRHIGVFEALQADSVLLRGHPPLSLAPDQRLDIAVGQKGHALEGLGLGFLVGGVAGVLAGRSHSGSSSNLDIGAAVGALAIGVGVWVGTTVLGGVIGNGIKSDRWRRVLPWPPSSDHSPATPGSGVGPITAVVRIPIRIPL